MLFLIAGLLAAQAALTNESIIKLTKAGLSEEVILNMVKSQPAKYSASADDLIALKGAGVSDKVISEMVTKASGAPAEKLPAALAGFASTPAATGTAAPPVTEVGVYYKKNGVWTELQPEIANFKTGGVLKRVGTVGIMKGDVNGRLNGLHSRNNLKAPVELLVYMQEGVAITEYQLLKLRETKDGREFRTVTGGVFHASGGQTRDALPFEGKKTAPRTFEIALPVLAAGDYGLLAPIMGDTSGSSGRVGKVFSFRIE